MSEAIVTRLICPVCNAEQGTSQCPVCKGAGDLGTKITIPEGYKEFTPGVFVHWRGLGGQQEASVNVPADVPEKHPRAGTACGAYSTDCGYDVFDCPYPVNDKGECSRHGSRIGPA